MAIGPDVGHLDQVEAGSGGTIDQVQHGHTRVSLPHRTHAHARQRRRCVYGVGRMRSKAARAMSTVDFVGSYALSPGEVHDMFVFLFFSPFLPPATLVPLVSPLFGAFLGVNGHLRVLRAASGTRPRGDSLLKTDFDLPGAIGPHQRERTLAKTLVPPRKRRHCRCQLARYQV